MKYVKYLLLLIVGSFALTACEQRTVDKARDRQTAAMDTIADQADRAVGMPAMTEFAQKKFVRDIYERTDKASITYVYTQGLDGTLICLGQGIGYGVPYGTRSTPPESPAMYGVAERGTVTLAQPEPNGLYLPDNAEATWYQMLNPETEKIEVVYLEPTVVITPFKLKGPAVEKSC